MDRLIDKLIMLSTTVGARTPHWIQGAGGNLSVKSGNLLFIKSSGFRLDQVCTAFGVSSVKLDVFRSHFEDAALIKKTEEAEAKYADGIRVAAIKKESSDERPSMETGFHAILPESFVFHFHSLIAVWAADRLVQFPEQYSKISEILNNSKLTWMLVPYLSPGLELSKFLERQEKKSLYLLQNHGILMQGSSPEILKIWEGIEESLLNVYQEIESLNPNRKQNLRDLAIQEKWFRSVPLYFPDTAVFLDRLRGHWNQFLNTSDSMLPLDVKSSIEIVQATYLLEFIHPPVTEIPVELAGKLAKLPVEKFRRGE